MGLWNQTPAQWKAEYRPGFLGSGWWTVCMNGHADSGEYGSIEEAHAAAAKMNYTRGSYSPPRIWGLDGVE